MIHHFLTQPEVLLCGISGGLMAGVMLVVNILDAAASLWLKVRRKPIRDEKTP